MPRKKVPPYIAVELEVFHDIPLMASDINVSEAVMGWGLTLLWRRAWVKRVHSFPKLVIEGALGARGAEVLIAFGYAEEQENGDIRLKGLDRYFRTGVPKRVPKTPKSVPKEEQDAPDQHREDTTGNKREGKTEDRRQKISKDDLPRDAAGSEPEQPELIADDARRKKSRQPSQWEQIFDRMQTLRLEKMRELGDPDPSPEPKPPNINAILKGVDDQAQALAREAYLDPESDILQLWEAFLERNEYARDKCEPPFALLYFASGKTLFRARRDAEEIFAASQAAEAKGA